MYLLLKMQKLYLVAISLLLVRVESVMEWPPQSLGRFGNALILVLTLLFSLSDMVPCQQRILGMLLQESGLIIQLTQIFEASARKFE
jgi:hypothetical protein